MSTLDVFSYAVADKAEQYMAVVDVLFDARERFRLQMRPSDVAAELGVSASVAEVTTLLKQLEKWGVVVGQYDTAAPDTLDEYYAARFLYQLTPEGVVAHQGVRAVYDSGLASTARLSRVLLPAIHERVRALAVAAADPVVANREAISLFGFVSELTDNAGRYMADLAVETATLAADELAFAGYKRAVLAYLDTFVNELHHWVPRIAEAIRDVEGDVVAILERAAAADAPVLADGTTDPGLTSSFLARWAGMVEWFVGEPGRPSVASHLHQAMAEAIHRILVALDRLAEAGLRRVSRQADLTQLATWFADADQHVADALFDDAFGLFPSRHFTDRSGEEDTDRRASFWKADPVELPERLRAKGVRSSPGRPGQRADYAAAKAEAIAQVRTLEQQALAAAARLAERTPCTLSALGMLDAAEFAQLLDLVGDALASVPDDNSTRQASRGSVHISLGPPSVGGEAVIETETGRLRCADAEVSITVSRRASSRSGRPQVSAS